ncbi:GAF domain-containing sensor histidine kinase, partial [Candidatus Dojkabacteria bacterium]|nr:GAF domain-containing sensor histidine kinase [Candidatus Dojkabacteria bacterium]
SAILPYLIFFMLAFFYENRYGTSLNSTAYILGIPIGLAFVYVFSITDEFLRKYTDSRLINPGYNPLEELDDLNKQLSRTIDLNEITSITTSKVAKTIRPAYQAIFVIPEEIDKPWLSYTYKDSSLLKPDPFKIVINIWARLKNTPLIIDEFNSLQIDKHEPVAIMLQELESIMQKEQLKVIYPLLQNEKIVGMLILGEKEADSPYSIQEVEFLESIGNTLALAVGRSLLYEELQLFNEELQNRVEAATEELKVKNTSLENALSELEDKRRQERDMVDVMGHELRTPISIARNALAILEDKFDKNDGNIEKEKLGKYLTMAVEATRREITLLETLLSATKLEGNRIQLNLTKVSVDELIENTLEAHKYKAQEKNLTLNVEKEDGMFIFSDKVRTQEIIDNFVSNAVKYTAAGSVTIKVYKKDGFIRFDIVDTGIGIQQEDLEKLGGKFFRARKLYGEGTTEDYVHPSGTGLGLFVTFELIHLMGGNREVLSEVGKGSTFAAELPEFTGQKDQNLDQTFMETGNNNVGATSSET